MSTPSIQPSPAPASNYVYVPGYVRKEEALARGRAKQARTVHVEMLTREEPTQPWNRFYGGAMTSMKAERIRKRVLAENTVRNGIHSCFHGNNLLAVNIYTDNGVNDDRIAIIMQLPPYVA